MRTVALCFALLSLTALGCHERNEAADGRSSVTPTSAASDAAVSSRPDVTPPDAAVMPWPPTRMTFAKRLKHTAVVDQRDPKTSSRHCRVNTPCEPFASLERCPARIAPIDALALRTFVPAEIGATVSVRGGLSLEPRVATTANACVQKPGMPYYCCHFESIEAFVGDIPNGARLEDIGCGGDESRLCCSVPAFGQEVVATGKITPETDAWLVQQGSRWRLEDATLCTLD